jgi:multicomponent Na+:H+ antiporter subunit G
MTEWIAALLMLAGAFFVVVSALGALRMPDLFLRMHAATKAGTLGAGLILAAALVVFGTTAVTTKAVLTFVFLLLTAPVGAHVLGRAAYYDGVPLWDRTEVDALKGKYDEAEATTPADGAARPAGLKGRGVTGADPRGDEPT